MVEEFPLPIPHLLGHLVFPKLYLVQMYLKFIHVITYLFHVNPLIPYEMWDKIGFSFSFSFNQRQD